ncbi:inositol polyphosphate 5-phosphatase [Allomyces javanicus]|nr:inositol polyphosphate 5-phosphatase [Allomyces javanicus]
MDYRAYPGAAGTNGTGTGSYSYSAPASPAAHAPWTLYTRSSPRRSVALVPRIDYSMSAAQAARSDRQALHLQIVDATPSTAVLNARVVPVAALELAKMDQGTAKPVLGLLGVLAVGDDVFVGVVTGAEPVTDLEGSTVMLITQVDFVSLSTDAYDRVATAIPSLSAPGASAIDLDPSAANGGPPAHPCLALIRLLAAGTFYYTTGDLDLSRRAQYRYTHPTPSRDPQYIWNHHMVHALAQVVDAAKDADAAMARFLVFAIQGYVGKAVTADRTHSLAIISRVSTRRAGTRYNTRGIDDTGAVANFVETEMLYTSPAAVLSFVQVRGSVPVFWDQPGLQVVGHKVVITRAREATRPAFDRHFTDLHANYGPSITAVNLLSQDGAGESVLGNEYTAQFAALASSGADALVQYDFHASVKGNNYAALQDLVNKVGPSMENMRCFLLDPVLGQAIESQMGVFRVNCVDCLDRTNVVQGLFAGQALRMFIPNVPTALYEEFKELWANNGDALSRIYAGTGALKSGFTRSGKRTLAGFLDDSVKSVNRFVINNFQDKSRQDTIDLLLGKARPRDIDVRDPVLAAVAEAVTQRAAEYTSSRTLHVHVGTYNVNGCLPQEPIDPWVHAGIDGSPPPDLVVMGFQEIVELTAGQIVSADPMKRQVWQQELTTAIRRAHHAADYVLVCDGQLVGAAILVFARSDLTPAIHGVEMSIVKTGLRGMTGNKGGLSVSLHVHDTSFCFVTAHFAAGQSAVDDRNRDYATILSETVFKRGRRTITDHDHIIWFGDFNYRIDLDNETVRDLIAQDRLLDLLRRDQLTVQRAHARAFAGYTEGEVTFAPTYKYNNGTHTYDTSEKNRIPAWCDRILYKSLAKLNLVVYKRAELLVSDHKPVLALFRAPVTVVDHAKKQALYQDLLRGMTGGGAAANPFRAILAAQQTQQQTREAQLISFEDDGGARRLPPPSTDTSSEPWWAAFPPLQDATTPAPTAATTLARPEPAAPRPAAPAAPATSAAASMPALDMFDPWRAASPTPALGAGVRAGASAAVPPPPAPAEGWSLLD